MFKVHPHKSVLQLTHKISEGTVKALIQKNIPVIHLVGGAWHWINFFSALEHFVIQNHQTGPSTICTDCSLTIKQVEIKCICVKKKTNSMLNLG